MAVVNYIDFETLFSSVSNASKVLNNSTSYDDGIYSLYIGTYTNDTNYFPNKFYYNNIQVTYLGISGNSFICFSNSTSFNENNSLKVNRRDTRLVNLWTEYCTVDNMGVYRIRWDGISEYSSSYIGNSNYTFTYDVALCANGKIIFNMVKKPVTSLMSSADYNGLWMGGTKKCGFTTTANCPISVVFTPNNKTTATAFTMSYSLPPALYYGYFIKDINDDIYGGTNFANNLGKNVNFTYRFVVENASRDSATLADLKRLNAKSVINWRYYPNDYEDSGVEDFNDIRLSANIINLPEGIINGGESNDYTLSKPIEIVRVHGYKNVKFILSFNSGTTWVVYDKTTDSWIEVAENNYDNWMDIDTMENISVEKWAEINTNNTFKFKYILEDFDSYFHRIIIY